MFDSIIQAFFWIRLAQMMELLLAGVLWFRLWNAVFCNVSRCYKRTSMVMTLILMLLLSLFFSFHSVFFFLFYFWGLSICVCSARLCFLWRTSALTSFFEFHSIFFFLSTCGLGLLGRCYIRCWYKRCGWGEDYVGLKGFVSIYICNSLKLRESLLQFFQALVMVTLGLLDNIKCLEIGLLISVYL